MCCFFCRLKKKVFDTIEHDILLTKFEHHGVTGLANNLFTCYLSHRKEFVSINDHNLNLTSILDGVCQGFL